ncbi:MAG TPA: hypothetical protein VHW03_02510 [Chthoniobacterales bacterium]|jgi:hypothetical protein|nr:hypothetical protein [Chthoniobacterales bacterium]
MTSPENDLAEALRQRRALIADESSRRHPDSHLEKLRAISERIEILQQRLLPPIDPQLAHFLARCSYDKALTLLEAQVPNA